MKISVKGNNEKISKKELRYAIQFMAELVLSKRLIKNLYIELISQKFATVPSGFSKYHGDCMWLDGNVKPREFRIRINSDMSKRSQLIALAHELVHVKQWATGDMRDLLRQPSFPAVKWKTDLINHEEVHYYDLPWEIEAYGREYGMYARYMDHKKDHKLNFHKT